MSQPQDYLPLVEDVATYINRGGVVHFKGKVSRGSVCNSRIGAMSTRWSRVNCIACYRQRNAVRGIIDRSKDIDPRKGA